MLRPDTVHQQARRDSNPQPPVLETGALPVELRTYVTLTTHYSPSFSGQGRNRTADTAIFSRVLYQLSYLAEKKPPGPFGAERVQRGFRHQELAAIPSRPRSLGRPRIVHRPPARQRGFGSAQLQDRHRFRTPHEHCARPSHTVKRRQRGRRFISSGGRIRTCDLRVMSPTSYQTAPPRNQGQ